MNLQSVPPASIASQPVTSPFVPAAASDSAADGGLCEPASGLAPTSAEVVRWVKQRLLDGRLAPGQQLPPERHLAVELGISRLPLREGLKWLQARGLVSIHHGRGAFVCSKADPGVIADALLPKLMTPAAAGVDSGLDAELAGAWLLLEPELAAAAARTVALGQADAAAVAALTEAARTDSGGNGAPDEWELHAAVAGLAGRRLLAVLQQAIGWHILRWLRQHPPPAGAGLGVQALRREYAEAVAGGREADARRLAAELIDRRLGLGR